MIMTMRDWLDIYEQAVYPLLQAMPRDTRITSAQHTIIIFDTPVSFTTHVHSMAGAYRDVSIVIYLADHSVLEDMCENFIITITHNDKTESIQCACDLPNAIIALEQLLMRVLNMSMADVYMLCGKLYGKTASMITWWLGEHIITATRFHDDSGWTFVAETIESDDRTVYPVTIEPSRTLLLGWLDKIITDVE